MRELEIQPHEAGIRVAYQHKELKLKKMSSVEIAQYRAINNSVYPGIVGKYNLTYKNEADERIGYLDINIKQNFLTLNIYFTESISGKYNFKNLVGDFTAYHAETKRAEITFRPVEHFISRQEIYKKVYLDIEKKTILLHVDDEASFEKFPYPPEKEQQMLAKLNEVSYSMANVCHNFGVGQTFLAFFQTIFEMMKFLEPSITANFDKKMVKWKKSGDDKVLNFVSCSDNLQVSFAAKVIYKLRDDMRYKMMKGVKIKATVNNSKSYQIFYSSDIFNYGRFYFRCEGKYVCQLIDIVANSRCISTYKPVTYENISQEQFKDAENE